LAASQTQELCRLPVRLKGACIVVYRSLDAVNWTQIATTAQGVTSYSDASLPGSFLYLYRVSTVDGAGLRSVPSAASSLANRPSAPPGVSVQSIATDELQLRWNHVYSATGYTVWRSSDGVNFTPIGTSPENYDTYTDTGLATAAVYYYRLVAQDPIGSSPNSTIVSGSTRLAQVTGLAFTTVAPNSCPSSGTPYPALPATRSNARPPARHSRPWLRRARRAMPTRP
jgi:hypothetical protein